jgi:hypothetical protein
MSGIQPSNLVLLVVRSLIFDAITKVVVTMAFGVIDNVVVSGDHDVLEFGLSSLFLS